MRFLVGIACLIVFIGVAFDAVGAHIVKTHVTPELFAVYSKGTLYQIFNGIGLILFVRGSRSTRGYKIVAALFLIGITLFSGSLYAYTATGDRSMSALAPLGGISLLLAWLSWGILELRKKDL